MKIKIFQSGKPIILMADINEFLATRPQIANVLQSQSDSAITITFFYRESKPVAPQPEASSAQPGAEANVEFPE